MSYIKGRLKFPSPPPALVSDIYVTFPPNKQTSKHIHICGTNVGASLHLLVLLVELAKTKNSFTHHTNGSFCYTGRPPIPKWNEFSENRFYPRLLRLHQWIHTLVYCASLLCLLINMHVTFTQRVNRSWKTEWSLRRVFPPTGGCFAPVFPSLF